MRGFQAYEELLELFPEHREKTLFLAVLTIVGNLLADVLYAWADPRIRVRS